MKYSRIVRWQDLRRWLPPTAEAVTSEYPAVPLSDFLERVIDQIPNASQQLAELNVIGKISFGGKLHLRSAVAKHDYRGNLFRALPGDLIFSKIRIAQGSLCVVPDDLDHVAVSAEYPVYRVDPEQVSMRYLVMLLGSPPFKALLNDLAAGNTTKRRVTPVNFEELEVPLPDLAEQKRLVAAHRKARKAAAALEAEATSRELAAVTAFEAALGLTPPPDLPRRRAFISRWQDFDRWSTEALLHRNRLKTMNRESTAEWVTLGDYAEVIHGCSASPSEVATTLRVLKISAVTRPVFTPTEHKFIADTANFRRLYDLQAGDVLLCRTNGTKAYVGYPALVTHDLPDYIFPDKVMRARIVNDALLPEFLWQLLRLPTIRAQVESAMRTAVGNFAIGGKDVEELEIPLPSREIQLDLMQSFQGELTAGIELRQEAAEIRAAADAAFAGAIFG